MTNVVLYVDGIARDSKNVDTINPGNTFTTTLGWITSAAQHAVRVVVDQDNYVKESDETNNEQSFPFSPAAPDLVVQSVTWTP